MTGFPLQQENRVLFSHLKRPGTLISYNQKRCLTGKLGGDERPHGTDPFLIDSTDEQAMNDLVISLMRSESTDYTVLNEHREDITHEIKKLVSIKSRMISDQ